MANSKQSKKRILIIAKKTLRNKIVRTRVKHAIKNVRLAADAGDKAKANEAYRVAARVIDKATAKGVYHKNNGSRKKSRLAKLINKIPA